MYNIYGIYMKIAEGKEYSKECSFHIQKQL